LERQREIQRANYEKRVGSILEVMVERTNEARGQLLGRTSQGITLNFTALPDAQPAVGSYANVRVTKSFPNSLVGELVE
jgi:tRNA-2-methylthio-N6-dimethylallyladenosine synthase